MCVHILTKHTGQPKNANCFRFCFTHRKTSRIERNLIGFSFRWILTAGHCLYQRSDIFAYFGINDNGNFAERIAINISNVHIHSAYNRTPDIVANDIGLYFD